MQKNRTAPAPRLRRAAALLLLLATGALMGFTAHPEGAKEALEQLEEASSLFAREEGLSGLDRLALAQSALFRANPVTLPDEPLSPSAPSSPPRETLPSFPTPSLPETEPPLTTAAPDSIVGRTMVPGSSSRYVTDGEIYIYNYTDYSLSVDRLLADFSPMELADGDGPQILIYHSHTTEAYTMDGTDIYEESDDHRTTDPNFNMIRIGEEMGAVFEAAGLSVIHDRTLYDYPVYSGAYERSAAGVAAILEKYPTIRLVLDVHRDALVGSEGTVYKTVAATVENCAQIMMVVGSDAGGQEHDGWQRNLSLAAGLQQQLLDRHGTLIRPIVLRSSRFNQHMSPGALLVEVGSHGNTLAEAITAARLFARCLTDTLA